MNKKAIITDIFKNYQLRRDNLDLVKKIIDNMEYKSYLRDAEVAYILNDMEYYANFSLEKLEERKKNLERLVRLRELLLTQLSDFERKVISMKYDLGMNVKEISQALFISESTYFRIMKDIYFKLGAYFDLFSELFLQDNNL